MEEVNTKIDEIVSNLPTKEESNQLIETGADELLTQLQSEAELAGENEEFLKSINNLNVQIKSTVTIEEIK
jgi:hypothetical protein